MSVYVETVGGYVHLDNVHFVSARRGKKGEPMTYHAHVKGEPPYELTRWGARRFAEMVDYGKVEAVPNTDPNLVAVVFYADTFDTNIQSEDEIELFTDTYSIVAWRVDCDVENHNNAKPILIDYDPASNEILFVHNKTLDTYQTYGYSPMSLNDAREVAKSHMFSELSRNKYASSVELQLDKDV